MHPNTIRTALTIASHALAAGAKALGEDTNRPAEYPNDAKLLALERAYNDYEAEFQALDPTGEERERLLTMFVERKEAVLDAMRPIPADTLTGTAAKARVTATHRDDFLRGNGSAADLQADALEEVLSLR